MIVGEHFVKKRENTAREDSLAIETADIACWKTLHKKTTGYSSHLGELITKEDRVPSNV